MDDLAADVRESLAAETREEFDARVAEQATAVTAEIEAGELDNPGFATGMELEAYVVDEDGHLASVPDATYEIEGCDKELGVHNLEIHTPPDSLDAVGIDRQAETIHDRVDTVHDKLGRERRWLALDGMWSVPPREGTREYLGAVDEHDGVVVAENMRTSARYAALDNEILDAAGGSLPFSVPGFSGSFSSILLESLATSIQPHLQIPDSDAFPDYFDVAIRTTAPVLALTSNSPFLPYDLYDFEERTPAELVEATHHELRIQVFEQSINAGMAPEDRKVRFPRDIEATADVVERLVADETYAPFLGEESDGEAPYDERYPELAHKRGTYWRWVRAVVGGQPPRGGGGSNASIRIEYRPLPTQPTATDVVSVQMLVCGLIRGLVAADHPVTDLPWEDARDAFYAAAEDGLDADLAWVTAEGKRTEEKKKTFAEVFEYARRGLEESGVEDGRISDLLAPIEARWDARTTPSVWKKARVREALDSGADFESAVASMQEDYVRNSAAYDSFAEWL